MEYDVALSKAWAELENITKEKKYSVRFLADEYIVEVEDERVLSLSCNGPAQPFVSILVLHYLKEGIVGLPKVRGEWLAFRELVGGEGYYPAFKKRVIDRIRRKYGENPEAIRESAKHFKGGPSDLADVAFAIEPFDGIPVLIELWRADEEFGPSADVLFDRSIADIFCTEDIVVMSEFVASQI